MATSRGTLNFRLADDGDSIPQTSPWRICDELPPSRRGSITRLRGVLGWAVQKFPITGEVAQEFGLPDSTGALRRLSELVSHGRLVLLFYRGDW